MASSCLKYPLNTLPERTRISPASLIRRSTPGSGRPTVCSLTSFETLDGIVGAGFGLTVELAQLDAERAVKDEGILAHRFAAGEGAAQPGQAELVLDRSVDQPFAEPAQQPLPDCRLTAFELAPFGCQMADAMKKS